MPGEVTSSRFDDEEVVTQAVSLRMNDSQTNSLRYDKLD
jgi:hypothetical protein